VIIGDEMRVERTNIIFGLRGNNTDWRSGGTKERRESRIGARAAEGFGSGPGSAGGGGGARGRSRAVAPQHRRDGVVPPLCRAVLQGSKANNRLAFAN